MLIVFRPERVGGHLIFTRMTVTYTDDHPHSVASTTDVFKVRHRGGGFFWAYTS